jgi:hypothetical protein
MALKGSRIEVTIDELVLGAAAPGDPRVARAVEQATWRALAGHPAAGDVDARAIGGAVADAVAGKAPR